MISTDQIMDVLRHAPEQYYRLVLVVGLTGTGKTEALRDISARHNFPYVNVNLELGERLLHLNARQRSLGAFRELEQIVAKDSQVVLLDNLEMLFDPALQIDPLFCLQRPSRNTTIVAAWNGAIVEHQLRYAEADHPEYRRYPAVDFLAVQLG
jgi:hypothetical protein